MTKVTVTRWCSSRVRSRRCLEEILNDEDEITRALGQTPWTSPYVDDADADAFRTCITSNGGEVA
jgi:hypothetical protein